MKTTCFTDFHIELGAKMADFAGYNMPIVYSNIKEEHLIVRNDVGVFDVSHMGEFIVEGEEAAAFLQYITSNDTSKLFPGRAQYGYLPNATGGIVDDLITYCINENTFMLVVNASNIVKDLVHLTNHNNFRVNIKNISNTKGLLAVQGPNTISKIQGLTAVDLSAIKYYHFELGTFAGIENVIISATGYTGAGGFELYFDEKDGATIWKALMDLEIQPIGLAARDTLRLEKGYLLYGNDIDETTNPLEARLGWVTKLDTDFVGRDVLLKSKEEGVTNKLVGFKMIERGIPRNGYTVLDTKENEIGRVTSGTHSPSLDEAIGMAYVKKDFAKAGTEILIQIRKKTVKAEVIKLPFV